MADLTYLTSIWRLHWGVLIGISPIFLASELESLGYCTELFP